ncbi:unnamed protein product [Scytosiphon promiscuus]
MSDPGAVVLSALGAFRRAREAAESARNLPLALTGRLADAESLLGQLQRDPRQVERIGIEHELTKLKSLADRIEPLVEAYTTAAETSRRKRAGTVFTLFFCDNKEREKEVQEIDENMCRVLGAIAAKGATGHRLPPPLPEMAAVPAAALALPCGYVERTSVGEIVESLIDPENALSPCTVVGMGGCGKTVLASAVVRESRVRKHFRGGIFWMRAGRGARKSLLPLLQGLARQMGAAPTDTPHGVPQVVRTLEEAEQHLAEAASTDFAPRLVVLDDVWEREVVDAMRSSGLKVLVTTRDRSVVGVPGGGLEVGDMTRDEAMELLLRTSMTIGQPGARVRTQMTKVVARCGRLPLLLAIAGSMPVVKGKGLTVGAWEELMKLFENAATMMWESGEESTSLDVVLGVSFNALAGKQREEFLKMAVLAPGAVAPIEMLQNLWEIEDVKDVEEEAEGLVSKCLLQEVGGSGYGVHDLLLEYVKTKINADGERVKQATALQAQYLGRLDVVESHGDPKRGAGNQGYLALYALWRAVEKLSGDPQLEISSYRASLAKLESREAPGPVANHLGRIGLLYVLQGKFADARALFERALAINEVALGVDHSSTSTSRFRLADVYQKLGLYDKAFPLMEEVLASSERVAGQSHPLTAGALGSLAGLLVEQGKYAEADHFYHRALEIAEKTLGKGHHYLALCLSNRATLLEKQGKYEEADLLCIRGLEILRATLGEEHPHYASTLADRAGVLQKKGYYREAGILYGRAVEIGETVLDPDHLFVASTLSNWGELLRLQGMLDEAEPLFARAIAIGEKAFSSKSPHLAVWLNNRATLLSAQGKDDEAGPLFLRAIEILETTVGSIHPDLASCLNNQAMTLEAQGKHEEAERLYERSLAIREKVLGPDHPAVTEALDNLARLSNVQGRYIKANSLFRRSLVIEDKRLGPDHPGLAARLNHLAHLLESQGSYAEAGSLYTRALTINENVHGRDHPDVAADLENWAELLQKQGNADHAEQLYARIQTIREQTLGQDHPYVAAILKNRAGLLSAQGKHNGAIPLLERCYFIEINRLGESHPFTVYTQTILERARKLVGGQATR